MIFVDTHTHLYLEQFDNDRELSIQNAINDGVKFFFLPNIDVKSLPLILDLSKKFPNNCFPLIALHPTDVKSDFKTQLAVMEIALKNNKFYGIGETGIDLYWDKTFLVQQKQALDIQCNWALENSLPIIIHSRQSHNEIFDVIKLYKGKSLTGIFHCFSGDYNQAKQIIDFGFLLGIGGPITYKKSTLPEVISKIGIKNIVLETDSPFLPPVPHRGERNESKYVKIIAAKIAEISKSSLDEVAEITTQNALNIFKIK